MAWRIREKAVLCIVPNMNPDGAIRGNLRTNAAGATQPRVVRPVAERSPEVLLVRRAMRRAGWSSSSTSTVTRRCPTCSSTAEEVPDFRRAAERPAQRPRALAAASPDFQTEHGYAGGALPDELLTLAPGSPTASAVSAHPEMPFKDNANLPDGITGWNGERSMRLGAAIKAGPIRSISPAEPAARSPPGAAFCLKKSPVLAC